jgi:heat shock transcription factor
MNSPQPPFNSEDIDGQRHSLEFMQKLQDDQAAKVQSLAEKLGPLSPNGQIPGLNDDQNVPPADWNMDMWLDNSYFPGDGTTFDDTGLNYFDPDAPAGPIPGQTPATGGAEEAQVAGEDHKRVQSVSSLADSPATVETVDGEGDVDAVEQVDNTRKRRRRN